MYIYIYVYVYIYIHIIYSDTILIGKSWMKPMDLGVPFFCIEFQIHIKKMRPILIRAYMLWSVDLLSTSIHKHKYKQVKTCKKDGYLGLSENGVYPEIDNLIGKLIRTIIVGCTIFSNKDIFQFCCLQFSDLFEEENHPEVESKTECSNWWSNSMMQ